MSYEAVAWAIAQAVEMPSQKVVLLVLGYHHNGTTGQCNPSNALLAAETRLSERGVRDAIRALEATGLIATDHHAGRSSRFRLQLEQLTASPTMAEATTGPVAALVLTPAAISGAAMVAGVPETATPALTARDPGTHCRRVGHSLPPNREENRKGEQESTSSPAASDPFDMGGRIVSFAEMRPRAPRQASLSGPIIPSWMPAEAWNGFIEMRKRKKAAPTERAIVLLVEKLQRWRDRGINIEDALNTSTVSNWTDVYEPKPQRASNSAGRTEGGSLAQFERIRAMREGRAGSAL